MHTINHSHFMSLALRLAEQGRLTVSPNPMVGCVIVKNNKIVGQGYHQIAGGPHAEVLALQEAGHEANGASAYVTLEPCCHYGKTPPCTSALISAGIKNVYISCLDPNPMISGNGIKLLQSAGIHIEVGLFEQEAIALNEIFFHYITHKRPFVISKWAMSLDGKTCVNEFDNREISGNESKYITHQLREQVDAILIGANTLILDNPELTARNNHASKQPIRIILAGEKYISPNLNIFKNSNTKSIIATTNRNIHFVEHIKANHIDIFILPENEDNKICLTSLLDRLGEEGITSLLVEGGMTVHQHFMKANLVNKIHVYLAPNLIGSFAKKKSVLIQKSYSAGSDFHFIANLGGNEHV